MSKRAKSNLYMESKIVRKDSELRLECNPQGFLFSSGIYRTKILPDNLPEWYLHGYLYKRYEFISAKGVKHLVYVPNYAFDNHLHKDDALFVSYETTIESYQEEYGSTYYKGYDHVIDGWLMVNFVEAVGKYFNYDIDEIQREMARKKEWY